jgi:hypothetical protein
MDAKPSDAVMTALLAELRVLAVAINVAALAPARTVTDAGTARLALLEVRLKVLPPVGATLERVTEQVALAFEPNVEGEH